MSSALRMSQIGFPFSEAMNSLGIEDSLFHKGDPRSTEEWFQSKDKVRAAFVISVTVRCHAIKVSKFIST